MAVKKHKPVSPGTRFLVTNAFAEVTTDKPEKSLLAPMKSSGGRNNQGRMTSRYRGGGHKRRYRIVDFKRDKDGVTATVKTIEYDPNRSAYIALLEYQDGEKRYIIAPNGLQVGKEVVSGEGAAPVVGNTLFLKDIPLGSTIHAIEMRPSHGAALARAAGTYATLMGREGRYAVVKMPSGEVRRILSECKATIGTTSNPDHSLTVVGKAGRSRWLGRRPRTRGVAMNPVDHPMGGGEGRASGGHPRSRNGQMAKGQKTRKPKKQSNKLIITRRKSGKRR
ncbi:50S ribosomal protein L2 [Phaeodactylibacter luteus]|uniref:Large ribosomal subunit protein uL2 n=1 Tax=Phaeodactylibacter luteus TaxID=1564516 RepID=A0A5C6RJ29_9BACT|nr:50S ribosomal protein L2 [Phaeodactylibacter luteus]TXB61934.1 50S ribosomal protein L2 [Phaeodactylibacter luteus]